MEDLIGAVRHIPEGEMDTLLESLGSDRKVTIREIDDKAKAYPKPEGEVTNPLSGRRIMELLAGKGLILEDPVRDTLIAGVAKRTNGYVGSDLEGICREAGMLALREGSSIVEEKHFEGALVKVHAMMNDNLRDYYRRQREHFKGGLPMEVQPPEYQ
jgi:transitional endoplasmic reticulum ATPase